MVKFLLYIKHFMDTMLKIADYVMMNIINAVIWVLGRIQKSKWHNFCGKVNMEKYANKNHKDNKQHTFVKLFIDDVIYQTNKEQFEINEKTLKIDCFDKKINFVKSFCLAILFLLFWLFNKWFGGEKINLFLYKFKF